MVRAVVLTLAVAGFLLSALSAAEPDVPKDVAVPDGHKLVASVNAKGVQVYKAVEGKSGGLEWTLEGPLADLSDEKGGRAGWHYDGPSWEAMDGSKVVRDAAEAVKQAPAPDPQAAIPWLLVKVRPTDAEPGVFAGVVYIQRLNTVGGRAPADPPRRAGTRVGVPYSAVYRLWARS